MGEVGNEAVRPLVALSKSSDHQGLNSAQSVKAMKDRALGVEGEEQRVYPASVATRTRCARAHDKEGQVTSHGRTELLVAGSYATSRGDTSLKRVKPRLRLLGPS